MIMNTNLAYIPDIALSSDLTDLDELEHALSKQEEECLSEILELEKEVDCSSQPTLMRDIFEAAKKGAMDYLDSMTDTGETFSSMKRSDEVKQWDDTEVEPINTSIYKSEAELSKARTMKDANSSAIKERTAYTTEGMSESGKRLFEKYEEIYSQRTKILTQLSKEGNTINRANKETNFETLSGLRGYRIGPVVAMPTAQQAKEGYSQYLQEHGVTGASPSSWLYKENMKQFDTELAKQLGFNSASEAEAWRKSNGLTVHEGPDGMFMVPSDVHSSARHDGYRSMMSKYMKGELSEEDMNSYIRQEKIAYVKHEARERGTRMAKGMGLAMIKDILKHTIIIVCKESYSEFEKESSESFINRIKAILQRCWNSIKSKVKHIASNIWNNIKGSILSEFLTALNDYLFGTFKNIFKLVRQMWGSIKNAFKIICNKSYSWEERIFEATKILSAGIVGILGFSLNELIEKGLMSIGVPFASFIAECLSGLFAGIMSAIVLMLFDNLKKSYKTQSPCLQMSLANSKIICIESARLSLSTLKTDIMMRDTYQFVGGAFNHIAETRSDIIQRQAESEKQNQEIESEMLKQDKQNNKVKELSNKYLIDDDF